MNIGQKSFVVFASKFISSVLGFVATIVFARILGAEVLGLYVLVLTVLGWLAIPCELGISGAVKKRISEDEEPGKYVSAAIIWVVSIAVVISIGIIATQSLLESYISNFDGYVGVSVIWFLIGLLFIRIFYGLQLNVLKGERLVHYASVLDTSKEAIRSVLQIGLVFTGFGLLGMLVGYAIGGVIVAILALLLINFRPTLPSRRHFRSLFDYAKYSWLTKMGNRIFNDIDILILGAFVSSGLLGIYAVAWSLSKFLTLFASAIATTVFPEISYLSKTKSDLAIAGLVEDALTYAGLITIPGLVGGVILAEHILWVYGSEFIQGATVLSVLILAILLYTYYKQLVSTLNGLDRPDIAFQVSLIFAGLNIALNIVFIPRYGIEGAAVASVLSVTVASLIAYRRLTRILEFKLPVDEIARQIIAAIVMGLVVFSGERLIEVTDVGRESFLIVLVLVPLGVCIYFAALSIISEKFRSVIVRNLPLNISPPNIQ